MKINKIRPLNNNLLVRLEENLDTGLESTPSGILLHSKTQPKGRHLKCKVLELGTKFKDREFVYEMKEVFNIGDHVLVYAPSLSLKITLADDSEAYLIRAEDVVAKLEN